MLKKTAPDWQKTCGLVKEVSSKGETEWVLEKHAAEFKKKGADFIKKKYGPKNDPERTAAKKDAVAKAEKELKKEKKKRFKFKNPLKHLF